MLGFYTRTTLVENTRTLLQANGVDFNAMVTTARNAGQAKYLEAQQLRKQHQQLITKAENTRDQALDAATQVLANALNSIRNQDAGAEKLSNEGKKLAAAAQNLSRTGLFGWQKRDVDTLLVFIGVDRNVFVNMKAAAKAKMAEAEKIGSEAIHVANQAEKARITADKNAEMAFVQAVSTAAPNLAKASNLEKAAKALVKSANFFTIK